MQYLIGMVVTMFSLTLMMRLVNKQKGDRSNRMETTLFGHWEDANRLAQTKNKLLERIANTLENSK